MFYIFHKLKTGNQLKFQQCSALAHCSHTVFKLLCREMTDAFITPKLWLPNMLDFSATDYTESGQCYKSESINSLCEIQ